MIGLSRIELSNCMQESNVTMPTWFQSVEDSENIQNKTCFLSIKLLLRMIMNLNVSYGARSQDGKYSED